MTRPSIQWVMSLWRRLEALYRDPDEDCETRNGFTIRTRIILSIAVAAASGLLSFFLLSINIESNWAGDFTWALRGADYLLSGMNPYDGEFPKEDPLFYPLPALFVAIPFTPFRPEVAGALFFGVSSGILAFVVTRFGYTYLPLFISAPFFMAMLLAQWSPFLMVAAFAPSLLALVIMKPSLGFAIAATYPNRLVIPVGAAIIMVSLIVQPTWPLDWLKAIHAHSHPVTLMVVPGPLILLALLCWRRREARLLLLLAVIPQRLLFYDQLLLWLVTRSARQGLYLALASWLGFLGWVATTSVEEKLAAEPWVVTFVFLPATVIVMITGRAQYMHVLAGWWQSFRHRLARTSQAES